MGTRGAFGVIIGKKEKIGYNQYDSYPDGKGVELLGWLREVDLPTVRKQAAALRVVSNEVKPTTEDVAALSAYTNLGVSEQSTDDWYCLTRETHGDLESTLECGYVLDSRDFPLGSLFCEWAYIIDLDADVFEVYEGFQKKLPKQGRWKGRPTKKEDEQNYAAHVEWCAANSREPWQGERSEYKAVELAASWPLESLPSADDFLSYFALRQARETIANYTKYPEDVARLWMEVRDEGRAETGLYASEWAEVEKAAFARLKPSDVARLTARTT